MVVIEETLGRTENEAISTFPSAVLLSITDRPQKTPAREQPCFTKKAQTRSKAA